MRQVNTPSWMLLCTVVVMLSSHFCEIYFLSGYTDSKALEKCTFFFLYLIFFLYIYMSVVILSCDVLQSLICEVAYSAMNQESTVVFKS